jgi:hypothetical protein
MKRAHFGPIAIRDLQETVATSLPITPKLQHVCVT